MPEAQEFRLMVEKKAFNHVKQISFRQQFNEYEVHCFRYELMALLDSTQNRRNLFLEGDFALQNTDAICEIIQKRLSSAHNWHVDIKQIKQYISAVDAIVRGMLARGQDFAALDFAKITSIPIRKKGRKAKPKSGKKRRVVIVSNGENKEYESVAEANRQTGFGYDYIKRQSMKAWQDENSL